MLDEWVNCQLSVTTTKLLPDPSARVSYCLLTPGDCERKRVTLVVDSLGNRTPTNFRRQHQAAARDPPRREESVSEVAPKLPAMSTLNQEVIPAKPSDYG